jgi:glycosyltransferase involved in cell wall biosynthesis
LIKEDKIDSYEIIYVDSKSTDKSVDIALSFKEIRVFEIEGECNAAIARNIGAKEAKGDILFFIDGDMELLSGFFPKVIENGKLVYPFVSGLFIDVIHDENWNYLGEKVRSKITKDTYQTTTGGLFIVEKELWNNVGGIDDRLRINEDFDLALRLSQKGYKLLRKADLLAKHYMIDYHKRKSLVLNIKYTALLSRKHILNKYYWATFIMSQYTTLAFFISLFSSVLISYWFLLLYVICLLYKVMRTKENYFRMFWVYFLRDLYFIYSFLFFYPKYSKVLYEAMN